MNYNSNRRFIARELYATSSATLLSLSLSFHLNALRFTQRPLSLVQNTYNPKKCLLVVSTRFYLLHFHSFLLQTNKRMRKTSSTFHCNLFPQDTRSLGGRTDKYRASVARELRGMWFPDKKRGVQKRVFALPSHFESTRTFYPNIAH